MNIFSALISCFRHPFLYLNQNVRLSPKKVSNSIDDFRHAEDHACKCHVIDKSWNMGLSPKKVSGSIGDDGYSEYDVRKGLISAMSCSIRLSPKRVFNPIDSFGHAKDHVRKSPLTDKSWNIGLSPKRVFNSINDFRHAEDHACKSILIDKSWNIGLSPKKVFGSIGDDGHSEYDLRKGLISARSWNTTLSLKKDHLRRLLTLVLITMLTGVMISAQQNMNVSATVEKDTAAYDRKSDFSLSAFPIVFFLPETGLAFGGAGITVFNIGKEKTWRRSSVQLGLAYTLKNQFLLFVPYELYFGDSYKLQGELGYYRYFYNYYGLGISSNIEDLEFYDADFPRVIAALTRRFDEVYFVGLQYRFDQFVISDQSELLIQQQPVGFDGGTVSTIGISAAYDSRDDIFYPSEGWNVVFLNENSAKLTGSSFDYSTFSLDASWFYSLIDKHILAVNYYTGITLGESPFFSYFYMSSGKKGRGFNDRRFIDKNINIGQLEYRYPIYKRLSGVAFASIGTVGSTYRQAFTNDMELSYGAGLRFQLSKKQKSNIRVDIANSREGIQFYLTIGEAF